MATKVMQDYKRIVELILKVQHKAPINLMEKACLDEARRAISQAMAIHRSQE